MDVDRMLTQLADKLDRRGVPMTKREAALIQAFTEELYEAMHRAQMSDSERLNEMALDLAERER